MKNANAAGITALMSARPLSIPACAGAV